MQQFRLDRTTSLGLASPAVTIGNFDGVHRGHRALVLEAVALARESGGASLALTFDPHPAGVLTPDRVPPLLTTPAQKAELLAALGLDALVVLPFTREVAGLEPQSFARQVLRGALGARVVVVGEAFRFGRGQSGDAASLVRIGDDLGFSVRAVPAVIDEGRPISSSRVREALAAGDVTRAASMLGRPHFVDGVVVKGDGRGRAIGFPTANLDTGAALVPARGVYAGYCRPGEGEDRRLAVVNVGSRPTFGEGDVTVEAHLLDFAGTLYGREVRLAFVARLRDEERFAGPEELVAQIRKDVARARALVSTPAGRV